MDSVDSSKTGDWSRLSRLQAYAESDPTNEGLLTDGWALAMSLGAQDAAEALAQRGLAAGQNETSWTHRMAHVCIRRGDLAQAASLLETARRLGCSAALVDHDLALIATRRQQDGAALELLAPWLALKTGDEPVQEAIQVLWLHTLHGLQRIQEACDWVVRSDAEGSLLPGAAGVASLLAIDADDFRLAKRLSERALATDNASLPALVARACVALAEGESQFAIELLHRAQTVQPADGRTQSALGMAFLQQARFAEAEQSFDAATSTMPRHIGTWHGLGWSQLLQGRRENALKAFGQAAQLDENFAESHAAIGLVHALQGEQLMARVHLRRARRLDAGNVTAALAHAVLSGAVGSGQLKELAGRLLDRPGFVGAKLSTRLRGD